MQSKSESRDSRLIVTVYTPFWYRVVKLQVNLGTRHAEQKPTHGRESSVIDSRFMIAGYRLSADDTPLVTFAFQRTTCGEANHILLRSWLLTIASESALSLTLSQHNHGTRHSWLR